ncbi:MAG: MerR family transcriptional regulator [Desulfobaccales bacterium]|nr:MerR family transcriptional regulator [Desulfobaccales bacterium]
MEEEFPRKLFYTIGEASRITGVPPHVLRYWESRGKLLKPNRRSTKHRLYRFTDIQLIFEIKRLRDEEKLTLAAMRRQLHPQAAQRPALFQPPLLPPSPQNQLLTLLHDIRTELEALKDLLE